MAADVVTIALVLDRAADAADVSRVLLDDGDGKSGLGEKVSRRQSGWPGPDNRNVNLIAGRTIFTQRHVHFPCSKGLGRE